MKELITRILDDIRGSWRFRRHALLAAWGVCLACWLAVFALPDQYRASARVFVDTRTALDRYVKDLAIQQDVNAQINFVRQSLLSRPALSTCAPRRSTRAPAWWMRCRRPSRSPPPTRAPAAWCSR
jgi:hypothetical protein